VRGTAADLLEITMRFFKRKNPLKDMTPASVSNPVFLTTPTLWHAADKPAAVGGADESGYVGLALTHDQRVRKNIDHLVKLHSKMERIQEEIEDTEDKLEDLGVDVPELYSSLDIEDED